MLLANQNLKNDAIAKSCWDF